MSYKIIDDLPSNYFDLANNQLRAFYSLWIEQKEELKDNFALKKFNDELAREWIIETGAVEGLYSLDRGVTQTLISHGINAAFIPHQSGIMQGRDRLLAYLKNQESAFALGIDRYVKEDLPLSVGFLKELHLLMTQDQDMVEATDELGQQGQAILLKGGFKPLNNNPLRPDGSLHFYAPVELVSDEIDRLLTMHDRHCADNLPPEVVAAFLHHRFSQIHPFQDGNGRIARLLASLVFIKASLFPLTITMNDRTAYIFALEQADDGDLKPLVNLFAELQINAIAKAISIGEKNLTGATSLEEALAMTMDRLSSDKLRAVNDSFLKIFSLSDQLMAHSQIIFNETADFLNQQLVKRDIGIAEVNASLNSFINVDYTDKVSMNIALHTTLFTHFDLSVITPKSSNFCGMLSMEMRAHFFGDGGPRNNALSSENFTFVYSEKFEHVKSRFEKWLKKALAVAVDQWGRSYL